VADDDSDERLGAGRTMGIGDKDIEALITTWPYVTNTARVHELKKKEKDRIVKEWADLAFLPEDVVRQNWMRVFGTKILGPNGYVDKKLKEHYEARVHERLLKKGTVGS
jgi:hypothetical protein